MNNSASIGLACLLCCFIACKPQVKNRVISADNVVAKNAPQVEELDLVGFSARPIVDTDSLNVKGLDVEPARFGESLGLTIYVDQQESVDFYRFIVCALDGEEICKPDVGHPGEFSISPHDYPTPPGGSELKVEVWACARAERSKTRTEGCGPPKFVVIPFEKFAADPRLVALLEERYTLQHRIRRSAHDIRLELLRLRARLDDPDANKNKDDVEKNKKTKELIDSQLNLGEDFVGNFLLDESFLMMANDIATNGTAETETPVPETTVVPPAEPALNLAGDNEALEGIVLAEKILLSVGAVGVLGAYVVGHWSVNRQLKDALERLEVWKKKPGTAKKSMEQNAQFAAIMGKSMQNVAAMSEVFWREQAEILDERLKAIDVEARRSAVAVLQTEVGGAAPPPTAERTVVVGAGEQVQVQAQPEKPSAKPVNDVDARFAEAEARIQVLHKATVTGELAQRLQELDVREAEAVKAKRRIRSAPNLAIAVERAPSRLGFTAQNLEARAVAQYRSRLEAIQHTLLRQNWEAESVLRDTELSEKFFDSTTGAPRDRVALNQFLRENPRHLEAVMQGNQDGIRRLMGTEVTVDADGKFVGEPEAVNAYKRQVLVTAVTDDQLRFRGEKVDGYVIKTDPQTGKLVREKTSLSVWDWSDTLQKKQMQILQDLEIKDAFVAQKKTLGEIGRAKSEARATAIRDVQIEVRAEKERVTRQFNQELKTNAKWEKAKMAFATVATVIAVASLMYVLQTTTMLASSTATLQDSFSAILRDHVTLGEKETEILLTIGGSPPAKPEDPPQENPPPPPEGN